MLKFSCENKSAATPIHAYSNDSLCTRADFHAKKCSPLEDRKVHVHLIAALFINYFHQLALFISSKRTDHDYFGETELCS